MKIYLNPHYEQYRQIVADIHESFFDEGTTIYVDKEDKEYGYDDFPVEEFLKIADHTAWQ